MHNYFLPRFTGGTVDVAVQETTKDGKMKTIYKVCGGNWGGKFSSLPRSVVRIGEYETFKKRR